MRKILQFYSIIFFVTLIGSCKPTTGVDSTQPPSSKDNSQTEKKTSQSGKNIPAIKTLPTPTTPLPPLGNEESHKDTNKDDKFIQDNPTAPKVSNPSAIPPSIDFTPQITPPSQSPDISVNTLPSENFSQQETTVPRENFNQSLSGDSYNTTAKERGLVASESVHVPTVTTQKPVSPNPPQEFFSQRPSFVFWHTNKSIPLTMPSNSPYEEYIHRWDNGKGVTIMHDINEPDRDGRIWLVGAQATYPGEEVTIHPQRYGKDTNNITFNWFDGQVGFWPIYFSIDQPMPLIAPIKEKRVSLYPKDPAVRYQNRDIVIEYSDILSNTHNRNKVGSLYRSQAWSATPFHTGDEVEIVIYIYTTKQSFQWYLDTVGWNPGKGIPKALSMVELDHIIELQRFPITIQ